MCDPIDNVYEWDLRPRGTSWLKELNASRAVAQCKKWGLTPAPTLEANRVLLKNYIKESQATIGEVTDDQGRPFEQLDILSPTPILGATHVTPRGDPKAEQATTLGTVLPHNELQRPQESPHWQEMIQATAQAVGTQIAVALAAQGNANNSTSPQLPHVIRDLAASAPSCSGTDATVLLKFLKITNQINELKLADNKQILVSLLVKTAGQLRSIWTEAILNNSPIGILVPEIVNKCLPDRAKQQLLVQSVYRPQGQSESLSDFLLDIKEAANILLPPNHDLLDIALTGINPPTRARLAGFPAPTQVGDLLALIPRMEVIRQLEAQQQANHTTYNSRPQTAYHTRPFDNRQASVPPRFPFRSSWNQNNFARRDQRPQPQYRGTHPTDPNINRYRPDMRNSQDTRHRGGLNGNRGS